MAKFPVSVHTARPVDDSERLAALEARAAALETQADELQLHLVELQRLVTAVRLTLQHAGADRDRMN